MGDEAHIRLIDAHAERDRGDHDHAILVEEPLLRNPALLGRQSGMIGERGAPFAREPGGRLLHRAARQAVDDAAILRVLGGDELP